MNLCSRPNHTGRNDSQLCNGQKKLTCVLFHRYNPFTWLDNIPYYPCFNLSSEGILIYSLWGHSCESLTLTNLYILRALVCAFLRPVDAYFVLPLPCNSGKDVVREFVAATNGKDVVPVRWHRSTTSLKTTNHKSFLPPIPVDCNTSLRRLKDVFPLTALPLKTGGGDDVFEDPFVWDVLVICRSSTSNLDGLGTASCLTLSSPSILANISLVLSLSSFCIFSSSILRTMVSTSATICSVLSYSKVLGSVWKSRFWKSSGYLRRRWKGFDNDIARPVSPLSEADCSSLCKYLHTFNQSAESWFFGFLVAPTVDRALSTCSRARSR